MWWMIQWLWARAGRVAAVAAVVAVLTGVTGVQAQQTPPVARVYGSISINGANASNGATVTALVGATLCGTAANDGLYDGSRYFVDVDSSIPACIAAGAVLSFQVNGQRANETARVPSVPGGAVQLNLTVGGTQTGSGAVTYQAGWNLVSGPTGTVFSQAQGTLYTLTAASGGSYATLPNTLAVSPGQGYWAYFNTGVTVQLVTPGSTSASVTAPAGQYVMVGNPSATRTLTVSGADVVYTYTPAGGYAAGTSLAPGQGAWVLSNAGGTVTVQ